MAAADEEIIVFEQSFDVPMNKLSESTLIWLASQLNVPKSALSRNTNLLQDWRGLAELFGCSLIDIENISLLRNPCYEMLTKYAPKKPSSIFEFLNALLKIERYDIIADDEFYHKIDNDSMKFKKEKSIQDPEISCSIEHSASNEEKYTAFICHHPSDIAFVRELVDKLEGENNFKLFIPDRDLLVGGCGMYDLAHLIKTRCQKMLVVLSPRFLTNSDCYFQISFAMALDIVKKERKIIPVIYEACEVPDILNYLSKVDYTRVDIRDWFWKSLVNSLRHTQAKNEFKDRGAEKRSIDSGFKSTPSLSSTSTSCTTHIRGPLSLSIDQSSTDKHNGTNAHKNEAKKSSFSFPFFPKKKKVPTATLR